MAIFTYKALAKNGNVDTGEITASDRSEALQVLANRGLQPVKLSQHSTQDTSEGKQKQSALSMNKRGS